MATYLELYSVQTNDILRNKIRVAVIIAAETVRTEDSGTANHANRALWAAGVFENPSPEADRMRWAVLAANKDNETAEILGATDAQIQTAVDAAVDLFATGE